MVKKHETYGQLLATQQLTKCHHLSNGVS